VSATDAFDACSAAEKKMASFLRKLN